MKREDCELELTFGCSLNFWRKFSGASFQLFDGMTVGSDRSDVHPTAGGCIEDGGGNVHHGLPFLPPLPPLPFLPPLPLPWFGSNWLHCVKVWSVDLHGMTVVVGEPLP